MRSIHGWDGGRNGGSMESISFIATLKPFKRETKFDWHQETALLSWSQVADLDVLLIGVEDDRGRELARQYGFRESPRVERAWDVGFFSQAPTITDFLAVGLRDTQSDWIALINSDIAVLPEFRVQFEAVLARYAPAQYDSMFVTVRRRDFMMDAPITTVEVLRALRQREFRLHPTTGSDIFICRRAMWQRILAEMPRFILGRFSWDVFLHRFALLNCALPIDASETILCYHPFHGSVVDRQNPEIHHNLMMFEALFGHEEVFYLGDPRWARL